MKTFTTLTLTAATLVVSSLQANAQNSVVPFYQDGTPANSRYQSPYSANPIVPAYRMPVGRSPIDSRTNYQTPNYRQPLNRAPSNFMSDFPAARPSLQYPSYIRPVSTYPLPESCPNGQCDSFPTGNCRNGQCPPCPDGSCNTARGVYRPRPICPDGRCEPMRAPLSLSGYRMPTMSISGYRPAPRPVYARPVSIFRD